jgi:hypothetical protein
MSDQTLTQLHASLKALNTRIEKLGKKVDELDILAYRYKRLAYEIDHIDVMAFEIRQEFDKVREVLVVLA